MGVAVILVVSIAAITALIWVLWRRPWSGAKTRYPVVLVPGMLGFDEIGFGSIKRKYFHGISDYLAALGVKVYRTSLPSISSTAGRAEALVQDLDSIPEKRVNLIAHSRGGLDVRYAISRLGLANRVASLTTIATPHRGTPIADLGTALFGRLGLGLDSLADMSTSRVEDFNQEVKDAHGVYYASVVASIDGSTPDLPAWLMPIISLLNKKAGPNDGMVPTESQKWGEVLTEIKAHHWAQIGWSSTFDATPIYYKILVHLRKRGL